MSVEVVHDDHGGIWVITGTPTDGYHVHPVGGAVATYQRKYEARRAIRDGAIDERPPGGGPRHRINDRWTP